MILLRVCLRAVAQRLEEACLVSRVESLSRYPKKEAGAPDKRCMSTGWLSISPEFR